MSLIFCALCNVEIAEQNDSKEHIIPNSIGGRKKVKGFICKDCNNKSGREWDDALAQQFNPLSLLLGIKRERKNRVIDHAVEYAFLNCGTKEGESLTPKHVDELGRLIIEKLEPFLGHLLGGRR